MRTYDLYGVDKGIVRSHQENANRISLIVSLIEERLGIRFEPYSTSPLNDRYRYEGERFGRIHVTSNLSDDREWAPEPGYDYAVVLRVDNAPNPDALRTAFEGIGIALLRRRLREYAIPGDDDGPAPIHRCDLFGAPKRLCDPSTAAATVVQIVGKALGLGFRGNEQAFSGEDDSYYDESPRFGTIFVFDNADSRFSNQPFSEYAEFPVIVSVINPPERDQLRQLMLDCGLLLLESTD